MATNSPSSRVGPAVVIVIVIAFGYVLEAQRGPDDAHRGQRKALEWTSSARSIPVSEARAQRLSDVWVEFDGRVDRLLEDDLDGSRHQRFIVRVGEDHTVLVSHNIDLAPRIPLEVGDGVQGRGEYVFDRRGGIVHRTHSDPRRSDPAGWIRHAGRLYD